MAHDLPWRPPTSEIPTNPGVYRFLDPSGRVLYVGKAKNLRQRLSNYFGPLHAIEPRKQRMVLEANDVRWTIVNSEVEALQLEYTWIKEYTPPYNVVFRDDKSYPYLAVTMSERYPRVMITRGKHHPGNRYFGPYVKVYDLRSTIDSLIKAFPVRSCKPGVLARAERTGKPCLLGDIGRCSAPCVGRISEADHRALALDLCAFMAGKDRRYVERLRSKMTEASGRQDYETAARYRDQLKALDTVLASSAVVLPETEDLDVLGLAEDELNAACSLFRVRGGRIRGVRSWVVDKELEVGTAELLEQALQHVYLAEETSSDDTGHIPADVLLSAAVEDPEALGRLLGDRAHHTVRIHVPQRGEKAALLRTVVTNAAEALRLYRTRRSSDYVTRMDALAEIQQALGLPEAPLRMECYDISHLGGTQVVGSMVVFEDGLPKKSDYRKFQITGTSDDTASIRQVLDRRLTRLEQAQADLARSGEQRESFSYRPGLLLIDGGLPQVHAAREVLREHHLRIPVCGIAKRLEELWLPEDEYPVILPRNGQALFMVQRIRDEAHRFAITYQRTSRTKALTTSLTEIPGVGPQVADLLLRRFGSPARIRAASSEDLQQVPGIGPALAESIRAWASANH
ncbi:MAG: excinuclease ABC subunit UvrC [Microbacteriaceae bacterium]|nr:excinuclease ABC subunit UvrC [Microbacteriaceae bacterium]MCI1206727.1 excinuclease ABC subunit UvrC [Microbacteriaceae bacterium]